MHRKTRRWIGVAVAGFWLIAMGLLARRELGVRSLNTGISTPIDQATESWMGVYVASDDGDQLVGTVHLRQDPEERHGLPGRSMTLAAEMKLQLLGKHTDHRLSGSVWRPLDRAQAELDLSVRSAEYDFEIEGRLADGELSAEVRTAGEKFPLNIPVQGDLLFSGGFGSAFDFPLLEIGEEYKIESFDPLTLQKSPARVKCVAHETLSVGGFELSTRRLEVTTNGFRSTAWIDDQGGVVRAETPVGLILQRLPGRSEIEATAGDDADLGDLLGHTAIRPSGERPFRGARRMTVELTGLEDPDLLRDGLPIDDVQTALGEGRYGVTTPREPSPAGSAAVEGSTDPASLAADMFVQSDHPEIRQRAAEIVGSKTDPWQRALRLHEWVFTHLEKEPVVSVPSALEVLRKRRGDCNEHTVLFAALARAAGLPTRIAIGLVWSDELEGFYYHAWPEVYLDERWIWMDPTLDQALADATHLKLLNGGIESWSRLLPFLGQLGLDVLEIE